MTDRPGLDALADRLTPVRRIHPAQAMAAAAILTLLGGALVLATLGFRASHAGTTATDTMFLIRTGLLIVLALASSLAAATMARPAVGTARKGWLWAVGATTIVPFAAIIAALVSETPVADQLYPVNGIECLTYSIGIGIVIMAVLTLWMRGGAPVSPERAGIVIGLAGGSLGALAYSMACPHNEIIYVGLWYTLAIGATTLLGRLIVPHFVRW